MKKLNDTIRDGLATPEGGKTRIDLALAKADQELFSDTTKYRSFVPKVRIFWNAKTIPVAWSQHVKNAQNVVKKRKVFFELKVTRSKKTKKFKDERFLHHVFLFFIFSSNTKNFFVFFFSSI